MRGPPCLHFPGDVVPILGLERLRQPLEQLVLLRRELRPVDGGVDLNNTLYNTLYDSLYDSLHDSLVTAYPPLPMMRWTEKSFMLRLMFSSRFFHWQNLHRTFIKIGRPLLYSSLLGEKNSLNLWTQLLPTVTFKRSVRVKTECFTIQFYEVSS